MKGPSKEISLAEAKVIAEQGAFPSLKHFGAKEFHALEGKPLEAEHCWMFFQNRDLNVPLSATLGVKWAHVVSKKGTYSMVQDFSEDPKRLQEYLQQMSDYFKTRGE
jgi:hypothetical protein